MASRNFTDFPDRKLSSEFRGKWRVSLFGCLGNPGLSLLTCLLPCYTAARNARAVGDHGVSVGLLYFLFWPYGVYIAAETRRRIRERKVINVEDPVSYWLCPFIITCRLYSSKTIIIVKLRVLRCAFSDNIKSSIWKLCTEFEIQLIYFIFPKVMRADTFWKSWNKFVKAFL